MDMELKRILAIDLRTATEKAIRIYGPNTLVVSSDRVKGGVEVIVATDFTADPEQMEENTVVQSGSRDETNSSLSDQLARDSFDEILEDSMVVKRQIETKKDNSTSQEVSKWANMKKFTPSDETTAKDKKCSSRVLQEPKLTSISKAHENSALTDCSREITKGWEMRDLESTDAQINDTKLKSKGGEFQDESLRAREVVDMVLQEMAEIKKEFQLAQKTVFNERKNLTEEVEKLITLIKSEALPVALETLLLEGIENFDTFAAASEYIKQQLIKNLEDIKLNKTPDLRGVHLFSGPSGSGKTSLVMKIARFISKEILSAEEIAVVSYNDNRLGAWAQTQMSAASVGIDVYKIKGQDILETLLEELSEKKLILIDTSGTASKKDLEAIKNISASVNFHVVLSANTSTALFKTWVNDFQISWTSLFMSKFDEKIAPWGVLQGLLNKKIAVSDLTAMGPLTNNILNFEKEKLVQKCLERINSGAMVDTLDISDNEQSLNTRIEQHERV
jgi:flagellar biosynthesis protein FlhF